MSIESNCRHGLSEEEEEFDEYVLKRSFYYLNHNYLKLIKK